VQKRFWPHKNPGADLPLFFLYNLLYNLSLVTHNLSFHCAPRKERMDSMRKKFAAAIAALCFMLTGACFAHAQQPVDAPNPAPTAAAPDLPDHPEKPDKPIPQDQKPSGGVAATVKPVVPGVHRFWDTENDLLFAAVAAGRGLDYASTINLRHRGINEAFLTNSIVDNHPLFAVIEIGATAASVGVSYIFHRTGHHRLERWTSAIHAGIAVGGAIRNYNLKSAN
jgi:hypothetical protein